MSRIAEYLPRRERNSTTFDNTYQTLGAVTEDPAVVFKIVNLSTIDVDISTDGTTDHDIIPADSYTLYDIQTNKDEDQKFALPAVTQFYVKGASAGTGSVYLVIIKQKK